MAGLLDFAGSSPSGGGGLLDFVFNDPGARAGLTMLGASSPKYGRGLLAAMQAQDTAQQQAMQRQLLQSQIAENSAQSKMREQQLAMAQQKQAMLSNLFGGGGGSPLGGVTTGGGINAQAPASGGLQNMTLDQVAMLKANGIDLSDLWKAGREGFKREAGAYYEDVNRNTQYMPKLDNGMAVSNGQVVVAPGYAQANAGIKGAEAGSVEAAKFPFAVGQDSVRQNLTARLDATKVYNPQTGREEFVPRAAVVAQPQYSGAGYNGGSAANAAVEQLQIMQSELNKLPQGHPDRPALMREMQRLGGGQQASQSGNFAAGPSAAETAANEAARTRAVNTAAADVVRDTDSRTKVRSAKENLTNADRAIELLQLGPTGSAVGALVDKGAAVFGKSTPGGNIAAQLDIVSANMVKNVPRFEGPQSNIDVEGYKAAAGRVADRSLPIEQRLAAAQEVKYFEQKALRQAGGGASGSWDEPEKKETGKQREFSMLPNAKQFDGKRMQAPDGSVYRSRGGEWVKE
jgi:hypothetical protein